MVTVPACEGQSQSLIPVHNLLPRLMPFDILFMHKTQSYHPTGRFLYFSFFGLVQGSVFDHDMRDFNWTGAGLG